MEEDEHNKIYDNNKLYGVAKFIVATVDIILPPK